MKDKAQNYDGNNKKSPKKFSVELTKEQISIIKAGLQYWWLADDYGYALWQAVPFSNTSLSDRYHSRRVGELYSELEKKTKVKPNYGWWISIEDIAELCKKDYKIAKKQGEKEEREMYEESIWQELIAKEIDKNGLNGKKIISKASIVSTKKLEVWRNNRLMAEQKLEPSRSRKGSNVTSGRAT